MVFIGIRDQRYEIRIGRVRSQNTSAKGPGTTLGRGDYFSGSEPCRRMKSLSVDGSGPMRLASRYECFRARLSTVSRAAFCSLYSLGERVPESFSLSIANISSLRTVRRVALWDAGDAAGGAA